jgi:hypothetical protein
LVSGLTGFDLAIDIVAVKDGKGFGRVLSPARDAMIYPKKPEN